MKFYLSCVGVLVVLLITPDSTSAQFRFRRQDEPATDPPAPPAGDGKICSVCRGKGPCKPEDTMDCTKDKLGEGMAEAAADLFSKFADDPTKYSHCVTLLTSSDVEIRGCVAGDVCPNAKSDNITITHCEVCEAAATACNDKGGPGPGPDGTEPPPPGGENVTSGPEPGPDESTPAPSDSSKILLDLTVCFWILCAAALKLMM